MKIYVITIYINIETSLSTNNLYILNVSESEDQGVEVSDAKVDKPLPNELPTQFQNIDISEKQSDGTVLPAPIGGKGDTIDAAKVEVHPTMSDMFVAYATTDGKKLYYPITDLYAS